jgi:hypothetical protein
MVRPMCAVVIDARQTGFALAVAPVLWKGMTDKEKVNVENWLGNSINEKKFVLPRPLTRLLFH